MFAFSVSNVRAGSAMYPGAAVLCTSGASSGLAGMVLFNLRNDDRAAFLSSGAYIVGMLTSTVFGVYPKVLPAVDPANSLTIYNASASQYGMAVGLVWWSIGMVLAVVYFVVIYRLFRGKVSLEDEGY